MPLSREVTLADGIRVAIWQITESAGEIRAKIDLDQLEEEVLLTYTHEQRKRQWLASRAAVKHLVHPAPANLTYDQHGKPHLVKGTGFISISHSGDYAAAVSGMNSAVGIDIEQIRDRIERVQQRFLSVAELDCLGNTHRLEELYVHWGAKEALYKLYGKPEVDFKKDIYIHPFDYLCNMPGNCTATLTAPGFTAEYRLVYEKIGAYMLVVAY